MAPDVTPQKSGIPSGAMLFDQKMSKMSEELQTTNVP